MVLSEQKKRILKLVKSGASRKQIASELGVRTDTVKDHISTLRARGLVKLDMDQCLEGKTPILITKKGIKALEDGQSD
jgi:DNA-binding NarL/FixJ family response regulator